ncbi:hypothetical protein WA026_007365 [Henosepilachna vigintioctopunctata]|uniref:Lipid storage droplets surface-binding protein 1 n=1 Tax=Henosepilachna vigintioctopunctata TaxID=420089 RepID=A0AAW1UVL7_9CUCU
MAEHVYERIKKTNTMISWTLDQAEDTIKSVTHLPAIGLLEAPLNTIDRVICRSLDVVESKIPSINLPPKMIYSNTLDYMSDVSTKIVKPVLKRADSVKQMGNTVLTSKYTEYAADKLDDALDVADAYIDKYFPDQDDQRDYQSEKTIPDTPGKKAMHTIQHVDRVSKKLQRRLTKRTIEHAKIIKEQGTEAIHVLLYVSELIVTDPKLAFQKGKELWSELSKDEPENQARPKNVEELFVLLVRESSRQLVHLINFSCRQIVRLPKIIARTTQHVETVIESFHLEEVKKLFDDAMKRQVQIINFILQEIESFTSKVLEQARQPEMNHPPRNTVVLAVPQIKVQPKASNTKGIFNAKHNKEQTDQIEQRYNPKPNGASSSQSKDESSS